MDPRGGRSVPTNEEAHYRYPIVNFTSRKRYLAVSAEAVSAVLLTDRKGRQCPVQYVSRTLNEAEGNYAPMEKLALALIHMTRRLR
ncbi:reverse transcriptase domain-containing protein, partial [Tanacetum coccineum]